MRKLFFGIFAATLICGCAVNTVYDPVQSSTRGTFILNAAALNNVHAGMKQSQVHDILGQELIIGYAYQSTGTGTDARPITIANPYKTQVIKTQRGECTVEYYATAVRHPDGIISDDELMPLTFCNGVLCDRGHVPNSGDTYKNRTCPQSEN